MQRSIMPSAIAATPERSITNVAFDASRPADPPKASSLSPSKRSRPTRTSSRNSMPVGDEWRPILRSGFDCSSPGIPLSSTNCTTLRSAGALPSSSLQMNRIVSAYGPFVMNVFEPLSTYSSPSRRAVDCIEPNASLPEFGSVIAHAPILSSVSRSRAHRSFCAVVPFDMIELAVSPTDTPIAVTMPGEHLQSSMIGSSVIPPATTPATCFLLALRSVRRSFFGFDPALEGIARHRVHAERGVQLAEEVVRREVAVLELLSMRADLVVDELPYGVADHLQLFRPFVHGPHRMGNRRPLRQTDAIFASSACRRGVPTAKHAPSMMNPCTTNTTPRASRTEPNSPWPGTCRYPLPPRSPRRSG